MPPSMHRIFEFVLSKSGENGWDQMGVAQNRNCPKRTPVNGEDSNLQSGWLLNVQDAQIAITS